MPYVALAIGGAIGAMLRYGLGLLLPHASGSFPYDIWTANILGCFFLGWLFTVTIHRWRIPANLKLALGTGMTGAFTTYSTFAVQTIVLWQQGLMGIALLYVVLSVGGGLAMTALGMRAGRWQTERGGSR